MWFIFFLPVASGGMSFLLFTQRFSAGCKLHRMSLIAGKKDHRCSAGGRA
jgi:hypothetical protein